MPLAVLSYIYNKNLNYITEQSDRQFLYCTPSYIVAAVLGTQRVEQDMTAITHDQKSWFGVKEASWGLRDATRKA